MEGNPEQEPHGDPRKNSDGSSPMEVLETMRNPIVELQVLKADNEKSYCWAVSFQSRQFETEESTAGTTRDKWSPVVQYSDQENPKGQ